MDVPGHVHEPPREAKDTKIDWKTLLAKDCWATFTRRLVIVTACENITKKQMVHGT